MKIVAIPNCAGCKHELWMAWEMQEIHKLNVVLEGMGERGHCFFMALDPRTDEVIAG